VPKDGRLETASPPRASGKICSKVPLSSGNGSRLSSPTARSSIVGGDQSLQAKAPDTGDYGRFQQVHLGELKIEPTGKVSIAVKAISESWQPFNMKSLTLKPAP